MSVAERLFTEGFAFDFFQAVRLLERLAPDRRPIGRAGPPREEAVRFRSLLSLTFPPSAIHDIEPATTKQPVPRMTVAFMGLTGPSGALPRRYTDLLLKLDRDTRGPERYALRAWFDLFNHRLISLFYRAWEKYRFHIPYERGEYDADDPDTFTRALYSFIGLGTRGLRKRLNVFVRLPQKLDTQPAPAGKILAKIDDLALLHYAGLLAQRRRPVVSLEAIVADYFCLPVTVLQFRGRWLELEPNSQTSLGAANSGLGNNVIAGERVWDVQSKVRLRIGPLRRAEFDALLPDRSPSLTRKTFFVLCQLVRFYLGPEFDFDVQLVLRREDVPGCRLDAAGMGPRLGWNTWSLSRRSAADTEDAVFEGDETRWVDEVVSRSV